MNAYPFATTPSSQSGAFTPPTSSPATVDHAQNPFAGLAAQVNKPRTVAERQKFPPTPEQQKILDTFATGSDMVVIAGAGTGKTSTITMLADALYDQDRTARGVYIAFNKAIATEVKSKFFYGNVDASTIHSLAFRGAWNNPKLAPLLNKLGGKNGAVPLRVTERPKVFGVAHGITILRDPDKMFHSENNPAILKVGGSTMMKAAMEAITKWCQSADAQVGPEHVFLKKNQVATEARPAYKEAIAALARRVWDTDIMSPEGRMTFSHDYYLKAWALTKPDLCSQLGIKDRRAVLFFDEAQDSRPCITELVMNQRGRMQIVLCGDSSQAIYRFTGCQDAMKGFKETRNVEALTLSKTFRFGTEVACVANQILSRIEGSDIRIIPDYRIPSIVAPSVDLPDAIICRNNSTVIENMLELLDSGKKVFCAANTQLISEIASDYMRIASGEQPRNGAMKQFGSVDAISSFLRTHSALEDAAAGSGYVTEELLDEIEMDDALVNTLRAVRRFGAVNVIRGIRALERTEKTAEVVVSTIHKSKGQQWDSVHVAWDISDMSKVKNHLQLRDELMLLYVGVTRAKKRLHVHPSLFDSMGFYRPDERAHDLKAPEDPQENALFQLCHALCPQFPGEGVLEVSKSGVSEEDLVRAYMSIAELFSEGDPSLFPAQLITEVGIREYLDVLEIAAAGFPVSLFATMLSVRDVSEHADEVRDILSRTEDATT